MSKETELESIDVYTHLMSFTEKEDWDSARLAEQSNIPSTFIRVMIGHAGKNPNIYRRLRKAGFTEEQIPGWFARPGQGKESNIPETTEQVQEVQEVQKVQDQVQDSEKPKGPIPRIQPLGDLSPQEVAGKLGKSGKTGDLEDLGDPGSKLDPLKDSGNYERLLEASEDLDVPHELAGVFDARGNVQKLLEARGVMHLADGRYMRAVQLQNGTIAYEEVDIADLGARARKCVCPIAGISIMEE